MVQLAWQLHEDDGTFVHAKNLVVYPDGYDIPFSASKIHGITTEKAQQEGLPLKEVLEEFLKDVEMESKDIEKLIKEHGAEWKEKLEELSDDPKLQEKLKELNGDADEIKKKLEEIFKEISEEN